MLTKSIYVFTKHCFLYSKISLHDKSVKKSGGSRAFSGRKVDLKMYRVLQNCKKGVILESACFLSHADTDISKKLIMS